jgi:hypothetical protein
MTVFNIAGRDVQVDTYKTWWPLSVVWKQQGVEIQVNPETHWWCAWLCTTTENAKSIVRSCRPLQPKIPARIAVI